ncbi:MAG TPA: tRNA (adenosine(37)-N6)-threonylcarbamoyltransferase complex dimerization subunit type 1 TsaB [Polyangia bacterium]|nr:tRNA (adenosine(37)-N6)-threonylcarbamoyltransferase complex dimerization subunit type 1 TsaB [Polyangia bacterium]
MRALCLDSATSTARVAIIDGDGRSLAVRAATAARHSSNLLRLCHEVMGEGGASPLTLAAIACGAGPGSFTGLRVGLAVAKGLAMPADVPLYMISSLAALALDIFASAPEAELAAPCIDGGKGAVHVALFARDEAAYVASEGAPILALPHEIAAQLGPAAGGRRVALAGNGAQRYAGALDAALPPTWARLPIDGPGAISVGRLALLRHRRAEPDDLSGAVPLYGRPPDITIKRSPES